MDAGLLINFIKRILAPTITSIVVVWLYLGYGAWAYTIENFPEFIRLILEHLFLVLISMIAAVAVGVGIGIIMSRKQFALFAPALMAMVNVWQSVPSLAVIALAYGFLPLLGMSGIGVVPGLIALFFQAVAPIVRNTYAGIQSVSHDSIEAATGMGMTPNQILRQIEMPNAMLVIMGGIRTSTALIVGTAPLAFLIGAGGLGFWIFTGIRLVDTGIMMAGAVPVALIAMAFDYLLGHLETLVVSKGIMVQVQEG